MYSFEMVISPDSNLPLSLPPLVTAGSRQSRLCLAAVGRWSPQAQPSLPASLLGAATLGSAS